MIKTKFDKCPKCQKNTLVINRCILEKDEPDEANDTCNECGYDKVYNQDEIKIFIKREKDRISQEKTRTNKKNLGIPLYSKEANKKAQKNFRTKYGSMKVNGLDKNLVQKINEYCKENNLSKVDFFENLLNGFFNAY